MAANVYFANMGRVRLITSETLTDPGPPEVWTRVYQTIGIIKKIEIKVTWEFAPLRGMNSILRQGLVKYNQEVEVSISYGLFDADPAADLFAKALAPCAADPSTVVNAGAVDTNKVWMFQVQAYITDEASADCGASGTAYIQYTVNGCYFEALPIVTANENEWIVRDLTCKGRDIKIEALAAKPDKDDTDDGAYWFSEVLGD